MNLFPIDAAVNDSLIHIAGLHKRFGRLEVLRGLDLSLRRGRVTAVVGPNGSGKTTLIKTLLGLVRPDEGTLTLGGEPLGTAEARAQIGYMPQAARFPENLTGREVLTMLKDLRTNDGPVDESLIDAFQLEPELDKPLRTLSGGNRQKVSAVIAFLFRPRLIILDEPTAGLDPVASGTLKDAIHAARTAGTTFLLTSHIMSELEELADDVAFLLDGRIQYAGSLDGLRERTGERRLERAVASLMQQRAA